MFARLRIELFKAINLLISDVLARSKFGEKISCILSQIVLNSNDSNVLGEAPEISITSSILFLRYFLLIECDQRFKMWIFQYKHKHYKINALMIPYDNIRAQKLIARLEGFHYLLRVFICFIFNIFKHIHVSVRYDLSKTKGKSSFRVMSSVNFQFCLKKELHLKQLSLI